MKVAVTGGSGFLGSYVVDELIKRGFEVMIIDQKPSVWHADIEYKCLDISDSEQLAGIFEGVDYVYHFAGLADLNDSLEKPRMAIELNVVGTFNVLEACVKAGVSKILYASSAYVFSTKGAMYGASKRSAELIVEEFSRSFSLPYTIIRYGSVYGERADSSNRIYRLLIQALTDNKIDFLGDGSEVREYIHASDAAKLSVDLLGEEFLNSHVILTGVEKYSYKDLLMLIKEIMVEPVDINLMSKEYKGHYVYTPYSFSPTVGRKLVANPYVDFGQGLLGCIESIHHNIQESKTS